MHHRLCSHETEQECLLHSTLRSQSLTYSSFLRYAGKHFQHFCPPTILLFNVSTSQMES